MKDLKNISITLDELLEFCKEFDSFGDNVYPEHDYEGRAVFGIIYEKIFKKDLSDEEIEILFNY